MECALGGAAAAVKRAVGGNKRHLGREWRIMVECIRELEEASVRCNGSHQRMVSSVAAMRWSLMKQCSQYASSNVRTVESERAKGRFEDEVSWKTTKQSAHGTRR